MGERRTGLIPQEHVRVGRVLHEDDNFVTVEVPKNLKREPRIEIGDRFLTLIFAKMNDDGRLSTWLPWKETGEEGAQH